MSVSIYNLRDDEKEGLARFIKYLIAFMLRVFLLTFSILSAISKDWLPAFYCLALVAVFHLGYLRRQYHLNEK